MAKESAGLLMYRRLQGVAQVLLVHPGGPYWAKKDRGAWTIPKGEIEQGEDAFAAARREFEEETGFRPEGDFRQLNPVSLKSRKTVYAWAFEGNCDTGALRSAAFTMEWPPHSGKEQEFPEVDRAEWLRLEEAKEKIQVGQRGFIDEFERIISGEGQGA
jgi:predicted NUDIX family NTP pyrophosphohydrolase